MLQPPSLQNLIFALKSEASFINILIVKGYLIYRTKSASFPSRGTTSPSARAIKVHAPRRARSNDHKPQRTSLEAGNTKPVKQTREKVSKFLEHQVSGLHLISTLELFILFTLLLLLGSLERSKLAPFILNS